MSASYQSLAASANRQGHWIPSSKGNPCLVCDRTKDGDCRVSSDGERVICHHPRNLRPGELENGWAFTGNTEDGRAAHFVRDKPKDTSCRPAGKVVPFRSAPPLPAPIAGLIRLARLPEGAEVPDLNREKATYRYGPQQETRRNAASKVGKVKPYYLNGRQWVCGAGPAPWPLYQEDLAATADGWILELEGERCAGLAMAGGVVAISQPGHNLKPEAIEARYRRLQAAGVAGVVYVADHDQEGVRKAEMLATCAAAAGLPFRVLHAAEVWPGIPEKGSIDDAPGTPAEQVAAIEAAANRPQPSPEPIALPSVLDELLGPAEDGKLRRPRTDKLTAAVGLVLPLRYNLLTNRIEHNGETIHGDFLDCLYLDLAENHAIEVAKQRAIDAAKRVARLNAYHPVQDYLNGLGEQLTPEEWSALDVHCFGGEDPSGWGALHLQRQLIGLVARALDPGCELHTCLVLQSDQQGIGKSTFWKILGGTWFSDSLGDLRDVREDRLQLHSAWIHEWGEIDSVMGKRESETLKRFITSSRDDVRKPYGHGTEQLLRSCGLVGTTNRRDFIKDPTGNRRFPIIQVRTVNLDWVKENRDRIWGSAVASYRAHQPWHYSSQEALVVSAAAMDYAAADPLRDALESWAEDHPLMDELPIARILYDLPEYWERRRDRELMRQVGLALTSLGWAATGQRIRYLLPDGSRTDKASLWKRP